MTRREEARWMRKGTHRVAVQMKYRTLAREARREIKEQGK